MLRLYYSAQHDSVKGTALRQAPVTNVPQLLALLWQNKHSDPDQEQQLTFLHLSAALSASPHWSA